MKLISDILPHSSRIAWQMSCWQQYPAFKKPNITAAKMQCFASAVLYCVLHGAARAAGSEKEQIYRNTYKMQH